MIQTLLLHILTGIAGLWIALQLVPNIVFTGSGQQLLLTGLVLGILNATIKPLLNILTLPLRILTLGLSALVINLLLIWAIDIFFEELQFIGLAPLVWTTLIIWLITIPLSLISRGKV